MEKLNYIDVIFYVSSAVAKTKTGCHNAVVAGYSSILVTKLGKLSLIFLLSIMLFENRFTHI